MFVWAKHLYKRRRFLERDQIISQLRKSGPRSEVVPAVVNFYHRYRDRYDPHPMGGFRIDRISDISRHLSALEDLLQTFARKRADSLSMLEFITSAAPSERTPLVLLAFWLLEANETQTAHDLARKALTIDSRCMNAHWIVREALRQNPDIANVDKADVEVFARDFTDRFCPAPFSELITNPTGDVHTCCPLLLPVTIGNVYQHDWQAAWNSPSSAEVRRSIHDGDFKYCSRLQCHFMRSNTLPLKSEVVDPAMRDIIDNRRTIIDTPPSVANLGHDATCNLSCPQCRTELIVAKGPLVQQLKKANEEFVKPMLKNLPHVIITNSGDPFASRHYRDFMKEISQTNTPGLREITLLTNGVLLTPKEWANFSNLHHLKIHIVVSIDAARAETYLSIRRRGDFKRLSDNLTFISGLRLDNSVATFQMRFAVQAENFEQMPAFANWARELDVDTVVFTQLANCGSYSPDEFATRSVCDASHPRHSALLTVFRDPALAWARIDFDNLEALYREAQHTH